MTHQIRTARVDIGLLTYSPPKVHDCYKSGSVRCLSHISKAMNSEEGVVVAEMACPAVETEYSEQGEPHVTDDEAVTDTQGHRDSANAAVSAAPIKRRRDAIDHINEELKMRVKRKLFTEDTSAVDIEELKITPTVDRFVFGNDIVDLREPLPGYQGASVILTNIFNTFIYIIRYKSTLSSLKNRKLAIQLHTDEHCLRKLEESQYKDAYIHLPRMVEFMFSMLDHRNNSVFFINQLRPNSCVLTRKFLMSNISYRSMTANVKNNSSYIELAFNNPFRFIFVGSAQRAGQNKVNEVNLFPFFGDYINRTLDDMYEVLYQLVSKEIARAKKELEAEDSKTAEKNGEHQQGEVRQPVLPANSLQMMESFSNYKNNQNTEDTNRLHNFLRTVQLPLVKKDNVDIIVTSGNSGKNNSESAKMSYLTVEIDKEDPNKGSLKMLESDVTEDSIYLSSYIRCRVLLMEQAKFGLQIYTRHAIKLVTIDDRLVKFDDLFAK